MLVSLYFLLSYTIIEQHHSEHPRSLDAARAASTRPALALFLFVFAGRAHEDLSKSSPPRAHVRSAEQHKITINSY